MSEPHAAIPSCEPPHSPFSEEQHVPFFQALMESPEATDAMKIEWLHACAKNYWQQIGSLATGNTILTERLHAAERTVKHQAEQLRVLHLANEQQAQTIRQLRAERKES